MKKKLIPKEQENDFRKKVLIYKTGKINAKIPRDKNVTKCYRNTRDTKHSWEMGLHRRKIRHAIKRDVKHDAQRGGVICIKCENNGVEMIYGKTNKIRVN